MKEYRIQTSTDNNDNEIHKSNNVLNLSDDLRENTDDSMEVCKCTLYKCVVHVVSFALVQSKCTAFCDLMCNCLKHYLEMLNMVQQIDVVIRGAKHPEYG